jgi:hypothetical protein
MPDSGSNRWPRRISGSSGAANEIAPSNEPSVTPLAWLNCRWTVNEPLAPANRPVPPVTVPCSTIEIRGGAPSACPVKPAVSVSPLAAVNVYVPSPMRVAKFTVCGNAAVN